MNANTIVLSTVLAIALTSTSAAHAADAKVYPGSACQSYYGYEGDYLVRLPNFITRSSNVGLGNPAMVCPIVRDNTGNLNGVESVDVRVVSNGTTQLVCVLASYSALGDLVAEHSNSTISTTVVSLPLDIDISTDGGTYSLLCTLAPGARIYGYRVNEY